MDDVDNSEIAEKRPLNRLILVIGLVATLAVLGILLFTNPANGGPMVILSFLAVTFTTLFSMTSLLLDIIYARINKVADRIHTFYIALTVATGAIFLIGLQTLGQLGVIDIALIILFEVLVNFYIIRRF